MHYMTERLLGWSSRLQSPPKKKLVRIHALRFFAAESPLIIAECRNLNHVTALVFKPRPLVSKS